MVDFDLKSEIDLVGQINTRIRNHDLTDLSPQGTVFSVSSTILRPEMSSMPRLHSDQELSTRLGAQGPSGFLRAHMRKICKKGRQKGRWPLVDDAVFCRFCANVHATISS